MVAILLQGQSALDQDRQTIKLIIIALLLVAALLSGLTIWYWRQTSPKRAKKRALAQQVSQQVETSDHLYARTAPDLSEPSTVHEGQPNNRPTSTGSVVNQKAESDWARLTGANGTPE